MQGRRVESSHRGQSRLPLIAPRQDTTHSTAESDTGRAAPRGKLLEETSRPRYPPRSRNGCWTCRKRKVKCDEQKPTCGQCARLGHSCDYNFKLAFKDDTPRVLERLQEVNAEGSFVWDPQVPTPTYGSISLQPDMLPSFSTLVTDEERERKAESQEAGTYMVVTNPGTFAGLPEYCEIEDSRNAGMTTLLTHSRRPIQQPTNSANFSNHLDPNTVILKTFEDVSGSAAVQTSFTGSPLLSGIAMHSDSSTHVSASRSSPILGNNRLDEARKGGRDTALLAHYREHISQRVIHVGIRDGAEDAFEIQARTFPPLFHAMMAISALSIAHQSGKQSADALDHYQQVLPAMRTCVKSEEDSISDGALFTHYLLFLYEIASAGPWESNMWQLHGTTLQKIITRRSVTKDTEPHAFLVWIIFCADLFALLSGSGEGEFAELVMNNGFVAPHQCLPPLRPGGSESLFSEEKPYCPKILALNQEVAWLATHIGITARDLRIKWATCQSSGDKPSQDRCLANRDIRVRELQERCLRQSTTWVAEYPGLWTGYPSSQGTPWRIRGFWDHIYVLYRVCVIYLHTSMYPGQIVESSPYNVGSISTYAAEVINLGTNIVMEERWECQYINLCLFIAGVVSKTPTEKCRALEAMTTLELHNYGENTATMRKLLSKIYDRQRDMAMEGRQDTDVDWVEEMRIMGLRLVMWSM